MNVRPFTDQLRQHYGRSSFIRMFDTIAGGAGRHVRYGMLIDRHGEVDSRRALAVTGDRWVQIDLEESGKHSAWHFVVTADGRCGDQGPLRMRASTMPTPFADPSGMLEAIKLEVSRTDHPAPHLNALVREA